MRWKLFTVPLVTVLIIIDVNLVSVCSLLLPTTSIAITVNKHQNQCSYSYMLSTSPGTPPSCRIKRSYNRQLPVSASYAFLSTNQRSTTTSDDNHDIMSGDVKENNNNNNNNHDLDTTPIDPNTLMDMDIIIYHLKNDPKKKTYIGAIQEDFTLAPLSAWTTEPAFDTFIEFVVHDDDRWNKDLELENVVVNMLLEEGLYSYGSRQVGGGKGLGNPHGEESELVYYVDNKLLLRESIDIIIKPDLEILW